MSLSEYLSAHNSRDESVSVSKTGSNSDSDKYGTEKDLGNTEV